MSVSIEVDLSDSESDPATLTPLALGTPPPSTPEILSNELSSYSRHLRAAHINAESLRGHIDEIRTIFRPQNFEIIAVSESWLKPSIPSSEVSLPGYSLYRNDRINKGCGGVAVYVTQELKCKVLYMTPQEYSAKPEFMFLEIGSSSSGALLFGVCYRPPKIGHLTDFENVLLRYMPSYGHVLIMGDMNTDLLMKTRNFDYTQLTTMFECCNMTILPLNATHHTADSHTLIDLIIVSDPKDIVQQGQLPIPAVSRHDLIYCVLSFSISKPKERFIKYRDFRRMDEAAFLTDVLRAPWYSVENKTTVNDMVFTLNSLILELYNKHAPIVKKRVNKRNSVPWLTQDILNMMAHRDSVFRKARRTGEKVAMNQYRQLRNRVKQSLRNSRLRYIHSLFGERRQSSADLWRNVKKLGFGKQPSNISVDIPLNQLNDNFLSYCHQDNTPALQNHLTNLHINEIPPMPLEAHFCFKPVLQVDTLRAIRRVRTNAVGDDKISIFMVKKVLFAILPALTAIYNASLRTSVFPELWKSALIRPLNKIPSPLNPQDYRPISILPVLSKGLERIVHNQISEFLSSRNILNTYQSGFRQYHSTETALLRITDDIRLAMDSRKCTILVLFDFSKAFDTVNHDILKAKLRIMGFSSSVLAWMGSYLGGRRQCVCVNEHRSDWKQVSCGVPQGSILGPLLFTLYVNDLSSSLTFTKFHSYADDLQIYAHCKVGDINETVTNINRDIDKIVQWADKHGLRLNPEKTKPILFAYSRLMNTIDWNSILKITVNGTSVSYCSSVKSLGLTLTNTLDWTDQVVATCKKVFAAIHSLKKLQNFLPYHIKLLLVKSLVFPYFNYCCAVINDMTVVLSTRLQRSQNYCIRFLHNIRRDEHITPFFIQTSVLKLQDLRHFRILMLVFIILRTGLPKYFENNFEYITNDRSARSTRTGSSMLRIPHHRTSIYNKSFIVTACRIWNSLPRSIKALNGRADFAAALRQYLFQRMSATTLPGTQNRLQNDWESE